MKKLPYIRDSLKFFGKYEVVATENVVIPCYNFATARSIKKDIIEKQNEAKNNKT
jgi:hypothetical protein